MKQRAARLGLFGALFATVVFVDQLTKWAARSFLPDDSSVAFVPGLLDLHLVYNKGAAFSLGVGWTWLFVVVAAVLCIGCAFVVARFEVSGLAAALLGIAAGGGVGNLIDRVCSGCVTDFLMTTFVKFPVFNVADVCITCAFVALFVLYWLHESSHREADAHE